ncbi:MAG TPA: thiamine-phosphate kinase [Rhizomicrobium sp.]|nr:thiamine-phosphate kinase [Rhizomicrobium sp.]
MNSGSDKPRLGEFELIAEIFAPLAKAPLAFGLTDDAAVATPSLGQDLVVTTDAVIEGVHFFTDDPPHLIAKKALRVNLSDLAAKGCGPSGYLLVLSLPARIDSSWLRSFAKGLEEDQQEFGMSLLGGDTTATPGPLTIVITAFGHVATGAMLRRSGAEAGHSVYVTGTVGDAGGGLVRLKRDGAALLPEEDLYLVRRYRLPEPRTRLGPALLGLASASVDVSDGLLADLGHIAKTSGVRIEVEAARLPLSPALQRLWPNVAERAVRATTAGDDYEIAFTAPPGRRPDIMQIAAASSTTVSEIGRVVAGTGVALLDSEGHEMQIGRPGYVHF